MKGYIRRKLTAKEKKELDREVCRQLAEWDCRHEDEIDALILWELHQQFGFGKKRLRRFYDGFAKEYKALRERYECADESAIWICAEKLRDYGVDVSEWKREM